MLARAPRRAVAGLASMVVVGTALTSVTSTASAGPFRPEAVSRAWPILAMGDSYSAGNGAGGYQGPGGCYRSPRNYAGRFADLLTKAPYNLVPAVTNVACSGAVTRDFFNTDNAGHQRQLNAVAPKYRLILLTITGNDAGFQNLVRHCLIPQTDKGTLCAADLSDAEKLAGVAPKKAPLASAIGIALRSVLKAIHHKAAPATKIALLGYPFLNGDTNYTIPRYAGKTYPRVQVGKRLHALQVASDTVDATVVASLNNSTAGSPFVFLSTDKLFDGPPFHGLYPNKKNPATWMVPPFTTTSWRTWYHPNPTGWAREADLLLGRAALFGVPHRPAPTSNPGWPTHDAEGPPALWAWFGAQFVDPEWVSCLDDTSYCIAGFSDDPNVHVIQIDGLSDVAQVPKATPNPEKELTGVGFTTAQALQLLRPN